MTMNRERFEALAEAYGGDLRRWPAAERDAAAAKRAAEPAFAEAVLVQAGGLDAALDEWRPLAVTADLREAVVGAAPALRPRRLLARWALGAGLAGACALGVMVGATTWDPGLTGNGSDAVTAAMSGYDTLGEESGAAGDV